MKGDQEREREMKREGMRRDEKGKEVTGCDVM